MTKQSGGPRDGGAEAWTCTHPSCGAYNHCRNRDACITCGSMRVFTKEAPPPEEDDGAPKKGWKRKIGDSTTVSGQKEGTWSCPGCGWLLLFYHEWRCKRCLTVQPGTVAADPRQLEEQRKFIGPMSKVLGVSEKELLSAHPADLQVLLDGELVKAKTTAIQQTAERLMACLPYRTQDPDDRRLINSYIQRVNAPKRLELGLNALDQQGVKNVLGEGRAQRAGAGAEMLAMVVREQGRMKEEIAGMTRRPWFLPAPREDGGGRDERDDDGADPRRPPPAGDDSRRRRDG